MSSTCCFRCFSPFFLAPNFSATQWPILAVIGASKSLHLGVRIHIRIIENIHPFLCSRRTRVPGLSLRLLNVTSPSRGLSELFPMASNGLGYRGSARLSLQLQAELFTSLGLSSSCAVRCQVSMKYSLFMGMLYSIR
jgi:hypothetical protein